MFDAGIGDDDHFSGLDIPNVGGADQVEGAGLRGQNIGIAHLSDGERAEAVGVTDSDEGVGKKGQEGVGALDVRQGRLHSGDHVDTAASGDHVDQNLGVHVGGKEGPLILEDPSQIRGIGEVPVMDQGHGDVADGGGQGLEIFLGVGAGGGVAVVADGRAAPEVPKDRFVKDFRDESLSLADDHPALIHGGDSCPLLPPVLKGVKAEVGQVGGFRMVVDSKDRTLFVEGVEGKSAGREGVHQGRVSIWPVRAVRYFWAIEARGRRISLSLFSRSR